MVKKKPRVTEELVSEMVQAEVHGLCEAIADQIDERDKALQAVIDKAAVNAVHQYLGLHMLISVRQNLVS